MQNEIFVVLITFLDVILDQHLKFAYQRIYQHDFELPLMINNRLLEYHQL
jgi:hypothetical protein